MGLTSRGGTPYSALSFRRMKGRSMKRIFNLAVVGLLSFPAVGFACGGSDCGGMDLPPPQPPPPGPVENLMGVLSDHAGLMAGLALAALVGFIASRQRKLLATKSAAPVSSLAA
jgi:hypothetical protein